jgi:hypothetical protein
MREQRVSARKEKEEAGRDGPSGPYTSLIDSEVDVVELLLEVEFFFARLIIRLCAGTGNASS